MQLETDAGEENEFLPDERSIDAVEPQGLAEFEFQKY